jgi:hypothetical protein
MSLPLTANAELSDEEQRFIRLRADNKHLGLFALKDTFNLVDKLSQIESMRRACVHSWGEEHDIVCLY